MHGSCCSWLRKSPGQYQMCHSCANGPRKHNFRLVGVPFLTFKATFQSGGVFSGQRALTIVCLLMSGCGQGHSKKSLITKLASTSLNYS